MVKLPHLPCLPRLISPPSYHPRRAARRFATSAKSRRICCHRSCCTPGMRSSRVGHARRMLGATAKLAHLPALLSALFSHASACCLQVDDKRKDPRRGEISALLLSAHLYILEASGAPRTRDVLVSDHALHSGLGRHRITAKHGNLNCLSMSAAACVHCGRHSAR